MKREFNISVLDGKRILLLGVSYRSDVGDTRYTPVESFYNYLKNDGAHIILHDPFVKIWEEKEIEIQENLDNIFESSLDLIVITTAHNEYKNSKKLLNLICKQNSLFILDTVGLLNNSEIKKLSKQHKVRVLGRGDIK